MSLYESAYVLFHEYIYGLDAVLTADQTLTLTLLSTIAAVFVVSIPFILVFLMIKFMLGIGS